MRILSRDNPVEHGSLQASALRWHRAGRWIVDRVDLTVARGEMVGLLGPNGAGKTVTLSMIAGVLRPTSGHIFLGATEITSLPLFERARQGLGFLPQDRSIFTGLSARDNVAAILNARGMSRRKARHRADELLAQFGLSHIADERASRLSGGEQRRLEVARSLAIEPSFLLFDEPFAGIDPLTIESLHAILVELRAKGIGILVTDHNVRETLTLCDRVYVLFAGRVLADGASSDIVDDPNVRQHFLGESFELVDVAS